jgi:hypothetical protein
MHFQLDVGQRTHMSGPNSLLCGQRAGVRYCPFAGRRRVSIDASSRLRAVTTRKHLRTNLWQSPAVITSPFQPLGRVSRRRPDVEAMHQRQV